MDDLHGRYHPATCLIAVPNLPLRRFIQLKTRRHTEVGLTQLRGPVARELLITIDQAKKNVLQTINDQLVTIL